MAQAVVWVLYELWSCRSFGATAEVNAVPGAVRRQVVSSCAGTELLELLKYLGPAVPARMSVSCFRGERLRVLKRGPTACSRRVCALAEVGIGREAEEAARWWKKYFCER